MIIGLISDTFIPDKVSKLPLEVLNIFEGVDLIIHAGNLASMDVKKDLEKIAPVLAVQGDRDREYGLNLPKTIIRSFDGFKIGVNHGEVHPKGDTQQLYYLAEELGVDVLISGHTHQPLIERIDNILLLNPGSPTAPIFSISTVMILKLENNELDVEVKKITHLNKEL